MVDGGGGNVQVVIVSPKRLVHVLNVLFGPVSAVRNKAGAPKKRVGRVVWGPFGY